MKLMLLVELEVAGNMTGSNDEREQYFKPTSY